MKEASRFYVFLLGLSVVYACGGHNDECNLGELDCGCNAGQCLGTLVCDNNICVAQGDESEGTMESESSTESDEETEDSGDQQDSSDSVTSDDQMDTDTGLSCEPPEVLCGDVCVDVTNDESNCGECGRECLVVNDAGECVDGSCTPTYSDCVFSANPKIPCSEVCQAQGFAGCGACGPNDLTVLWYSMTNNCENGTHVTSTGGFCQDQPSDSAFFDYRCCCAQQ